MTKTEVMILHSKALFMQSLLSQLMTVTQTKNIDAILLLLSDPKRRKWVQKFEMRQNKNPLNEGWETPKDPQKSPGTPECRVFSQHHAQGGQKSS